MKSPQVASEPIGERIRLLRMQRGWSVRHAADLAGISHSQWSRIERGERSADNRFILAAIAQALRVALSDLTGHIGLASDLDKADTKTSVYHLMQAVVESDLDDRPTTRPQPIEPLLRQLDLAISLRLKCDYTGAAGIIPDLLRGLHAVAFGADRQAALRALVLAEDTASFVVRYLGDPASAVLVADRGRQAATLLDDPVMAGMAAWSQAHAASGCGLYQRAQRIAGHAAQDLEGRLDLPDAQEMLGQLYMVSGFAYYAQGDEESANAAIAEAERIATITGQSDALGLNFGPIGIACWKISMEADGGDPGHAVQVARSVDSTGLTAVALSRQTAFYVDTARALSNIGKDAEALRMLLLAERIAPQRVRLSPLVAETVRALLEKAKRGRGWADLRGLCERVGVVW
jgi:transcriptional regulator with XRE-family HTH domain